MVAAPLQTIRIDGNYPNATGHIGMRYYEGHTHTF